MVAGHGGRLLIRRSPLKRASQLLVFVGIYIVAVLAVNLPQIVESEDWLVRWVLQPFVGVIAVITCAAVVPAFRALTSRPTLMVEGGRLTISDKAILSRPLIVNKSDVEEVDLQGGEPTSLSAGRVFSVSPFAERFNLRIVLVKPIDVPARRGVFGNWWWRLRTPLNIEHGEFLAPLADAQYLGMVLNMRDQLEARERLTSWLSS